MGWIIGVDGAGRDFDVGGVKCVSDAGWNFGLVGVGLRCFVEKMLLNVSQNLQESSCAEVSC